jgi:hypothetical protein
MSQHGPPHAEDAPQPEGAVQDRHRQDQVGTEGTATVLAALHGGERRAASALRRVLAQIGTG